MYILYSTLITAGYPVKCLGKRDDVSVMQSIFITAGRYVMMYEYSVAAYLKAARGKEAPRACLVRA